MKFVDFRVKKEMSYDVLSKSYVGPYTGANMLRKEFNQIVNWTKKNRLRSGKWFFVELDGPETDSSKRRWEASVEVIGKLPAKLVTGIESKKLTSTLVASVIFDPEIVSARLVYHGLESWLDWRKKQGEYEAAGRTREVYLGDPWTDKKAWANLEVQVPIRKLQTRRIR